MDFSVNIIPNKIKRSEMIVRYNITLSLEQGWADGVTVGEQT